MVGDGGRTWDVGGSGSDGGDGRRWLTVAIEGGDVGGSGNDESHGKKWLAMTVEEGDVGGSGSDGSSGGDSGSSYAFKAMVMIKMTATYNERRCRRCCRCC